MDTKVKSILQDALEQYQESCNSKWVNLFIRDRNRAERHRRNKELAVRLAKQKLKYILPPEKVANLLQELSEAMGDQHMISENQVKNLSDKVEAAKGILVVVGAVCVAAASVAIMIYFPQSVPELFLAFAGPFWQYFFTSFIDKPVIANGTQMPCKALHHYFMDYQGQDRVLIVDGEPIYRPY